MNDVCVSSIEGCTTQGSSARPLSGCLDTSPIALMSCLSCSQPTRLGLGPCRQAGCCVMAVQVIRLRACGGGRTDGPLWGHSRCVSAVFSAAAGSKPVCVYGVQRSVNPPHSVRCYSVRRQAFACHTISQHGVHAHFGGWVDDLFSLFRGLHTCYLGQQPYTGCTVMDSSL